jgi:hypothetical protein
LKSLAVALALVVPVAVPVAGQVVPVLVLTQR